jgi:lysozyme
MRTSNNGLKLIREFESLHDGDLSKIGLQPKMDPVGIWTEGYGRAMRDKKGKFIKGSANKELAYSLQTIKTVAEADSALIQDVGPREHVVMQNIDVPLNQNQFDALVSYVYNTGGSNTLYNLINRKATKQEIYNWFTTRYIQSEGRVLPGLVKRRKKEADLYFK